MSRDSLDVVIVGAGAAGIAAARTALAFGLTVQILEAGARIGGRAFTDQIVPGSHWDHGAYWLHDAPHNFYARFAAQAGFALDETPRHFYLHRPNGWSDAEAIQARQDYFDRAFAAIDSVGAEGRDLAASEVVPPHPRLRVMFESWYAALQGAEPEHSSTLDDFRYRNGGNWRVRPGYGALVAAYGRDLPVRLSCPARRIRWSGRGVTVETDDGTLQCRAAIVTASTTALARGAVAFDPPLPGQLRDGFEAIPLGAAEKVALAFDRDVFGVPDNSHVHFEHTTPETMRFHMRPGGRLIAVGYVAGDFAIELEGLGSGAMIEFAMSKLVEAFGSDVRRACIAAQATHWRSNPYIGGGYSVARPGAADLRAVFSTPVGERIFFAGEAGSTAGFGTVHGAHDTGVRAARQARDAVLGVRSA